MLRQRLSALAATARHASASSVYAAKATAAARARAMGLQSLYPAHVPTTALQKARLAAGAIVAVLLDPMRTELFAVIDDTTAKSALPALHARMLTDPVGQRILREKPRVRTNSVDLDYLRTLPAHTFGSAYVRFLDANGFSPDARALVQYVDDAELAYVLQRYREVHDFVHVLFDVPPTIFGEVMIKHVDKVQTALPFTTIITTGGWTKLSADERRLARVQFIPWATRAGRRATFMLNVAYEDEFTTPLNELRARLDVEVAPPFPVASPFATSSSSSSASGVASVVDSMS